MRLTTLSEHYGVPHDETVADEEWLQLAGGRGWVVFMKDTRIRYKPTEREAVRRHAVRCFCLSSQSLSGGEMSRRFLTNLGGIARACADPGPFIYAVHATRIERLVMGSGG